MSLIIEQEVRTRYNSDNYSKGDVKFRQRALMVRFFERFFDQSAQPSFLTLPGEDWLFELMLLQKIPLASFLGVERDTTVYFKSRQRIPRNALAYVSAIDLAQFSDCTIGSTTVHYTRVSNGLLPNGDPIHKAKHLRSSRLVHMDVNSLLGMLTIDHGATYSQKRDFMKKFGRKSGVWLDYTGTLNQGVLDALSCLGMFLVPDDSIKPIAITVLNGRDKYKSRQARVDAITTAMPGFEVKRVWTYQGQNGSSMLTVCGTMR